MIGGTYVSITGDVTVIAFSPDLGATWYDATGPTGHVSMLAVSNVDAMLVYAVEETLAATHKVWRSFDGGASWSDVTLNLPALAVKCVMIDDTYAAFGESVYIGMELGGVWNLKFGVAGAQWTLLSNGITRNLTHLTLHQGSRSSFGSHLGGRAGA